MKVSPVVFRAVLFISVITRILVTPLAFPEVSYPNHLAAAILWVAGAINILVHPREWGRAIGIVLVILSAVELLYFMGFGSEAMQWTPLGLIALLALISTTIICFIVSRQNSTLKTGRVAVVVPLVRIAFIWMLLLSSQFVWQLYAPSFAAEWVSAAPSIGRSLRLFILGATLAWQANYGWWTLFAAILCALELTSWSPQIRRMSAIIRIGYVVLLLLGSIGVLFL